MAAITAAQVGLAQDDQLWWSISAECSDFVRLNQGRIRQAGTVDQVEITLVMVRSRRQAVASTTVGVGQDLVDAVAGLRRETECMVDHMPEDPYQLWDDQPRQQASGTDMAPVDAHAAVACIADAAADLDLVGMWSSGWLERGLISSHGHALWHRAANWCFDWSIYQAGDKAVKLTRGGSIWDPRAVLQAISEARDVLPVLARPAKVLAPGHYRTWLAPMANARLLGMFNWGGFSTRSQRTSTSVLQRVVDGHQRLSPMLHLSDHPAAGGSPPFTATGHALPERVDLVADGGVINSLSGPRSAAEYSLPITSAGEYAGHLVCSPGNLADSEVLQQLGTGIHVADCWYTNWSERNQARVTGMTRFHSFWVENGEIVAPIGVMRFDDSLLEGYGARLEALGQRVDVAPNTSTYGSRQFGHSAMPGALINDWHYPL